MYEKMNKELKEKIRKVIQELEYKDVNKLTEDQQYDLYLDWCRSQENIPHE